MVLPSWELLKDWYQCMPKSFYFPRALKELNAVQEKNSRKPTSVFYSEYCSIILKSLPVPMPNLKSFFKTKLVFFCFPFPLCQQLPLIFLFPFLLLSYFFNFIFKASQKVLKSLTPPPHPQAGVEMRAKLYTYLANYS